MNKNGNTLIASTSSCRGVSSWPRRFNPSSATFRFSQVSLHLKISILQNTNLETHPAETWWTKRKYASITAMVLFCLQ